MAEENQLSLSNLEGVTPSTSQETTQINNELSLSNLEGVETDVVSNDLSLQNLEGVTFTKTPERTPIKVEGILPQYTDGSIDRKFLIDTSEPTTKEKIAYGLDKQNMFFGNVFRVAKAGLSAAFDPNKEFEEIALENAAVEKAELYKRHEKFKGGKYDDDIEVLAAEMATFLVDPYYLFMYATPWGRAMSMRQTGFKAMAKVAGLSAGTVSLDKLFDNLATTGKANPADVALAGGAAGLLGPASMKAFQIIGKLLPKADKGKIAQIVEVIDGKTQAQLGVSKAEYRTLQKIAGDKEFLKLNQQLKKTETTSKTLISNQAKQEKEYLQSVLKIDKDIAKLKADRKLIKSDVVGLIDKKKATKSISKKIAQIKKAEEARKKAFNKAQTELWKKNSLISKKVIDETVKRDVQFLEKLWKEKGLTEKTAQVVLSASIRPLMGAATGYGFGKLWGPDDANLNNWMLVGASFGGISKGIQASKTLPGQSKNMIQRLLYQDATKFTFQKVRELTSTTTSTKLAAIGGETEKIGLQLLEGIDSSFAKNSVTQRAENLLQTWRLRTANVNKPYSLDEQALALSVIRGSKAKVSNRVKTLASKLEKELQDFKKLREEAGIFSLNEKTGKLIDIKNYFPRVYDFSKIKEDPKKFEKVLISIYKSLGQSDKNAKSSAMSFAKSLQNADDSVINKEAISDYVQGITKKVGVLKNNPLSEHITKARILEGPYAKVEKVLNDNGYLVNNANDVLFNLYNRSMKSIAFAEKFGNQGQMLKPYLDSIVQKYKDAAGKQIGITNENWKAKARAEIDLVMNTIDGYFGRYGTKQLGVSKSIAGTLATISNLNMLDRVTIASLGDVVQPFANSNNLLSFIKGATRTALTNRRETGLAKNLNQNLENEIRAWLKSTGSKTTDKLNRSKLSSTLGDEAVLKFDDATQAANVMGEMGTLRKVNEFGFKIMGLQWLTGLARRYAYNVGAVDAYTSASKLSKFVSAGGKINSSKGLKLVKDLNKYSIDVQDGLKLGSFKNFDDAIVDKTNKKILNQSGLLAANRDALIPQVQNRLLFAQSRNPWVRLMGQFTSWAMAKSAQTNKILQRIENGEAKQMVKLLAALPVYGGIQMLRELAKDGEVITDPAYNEDKWWAESLRLSGMSGILPELVIGRLTGPGSRQPWFIPFPAASVATDVGLIGKDVLKGETEKATRRFWEKIVPFPTYRKWLVDLFSGVERTRTYNKSNVDSSNNVIKPQKFSDGGAVFRRKKYAAGDLALSNLEGVNVSKINTSQLTNNDKYIVGDNLNYDLNFKEEKVIEKKPMNKKKLTTVASAAVMAATGATANIDNEVNNYIDKIKKYEGTGKVIIIDGKKYFKNYRLGDEEFITSGYGFYNKNNKEDGMVSEEQANKDLKNNIKLKLIETKKNIKNFDNLSDNLKKNIVSSWYRGSLSGSPKTIKLINEGKFKEAAVEFLNNVEYKEAVKSGSGVAKRMEDVANAIKMEALQKFNIGGLAAKLATKAISKYGVKRGDTAISTTVGTYKKVNKIFDDANVKTVHDFGSGLGLGSKEFTNKIVTNHEPFVPVEKIIKVKGKVPDYKTADDVIFKEGFASKDGVVNANVLNVIEDPIERANVVRQISQLISNKGMAVITTRGSEVTKAAQTSKNATPFNDGWIFGKGDKKTFQKGYSQKELEEYIKSILGDKFKVEKIPSKYKIGTSGVIIKKIKGDK
jgi:GH24 family phage-related lysozyme (muramidase)